MSFCFKPSCSMQSYFYKYQERYNLVVYSLLFNIPDDEKYPWNYRRINTLKYKYNTLGLT